MKSYMNKCPVANRHQSLDEPPNRWRFFVEWLFDSLTPGVPVASTMGASSLKSPASIWRGVVFIALVVGMMAMGRVAWADLNDGLVAYYPFEGSANDESGNGLDGTVNGAILTEDRFGNAHSAYSFDGNSSSIVVSSSSSLNPVDQLSIAFWINIEDTTNRFSFILHKGGSNVVNSFQNREYGAYMDGLRFIVASAGNSSGQHYLYSSAAKLGEWIFYTAVIDRQNHSMKIYLNGTLNAEKDESYSSFNNNDYDLVFGGRGEGHSSYSPFNGKLDDVCIYNRALSENEIQSLYTGVDECNSPPQPPVNVAPASCQLYAVNDKGLNNSQFFTVNLDDLTVSELGPMYEGHDIEALAIHPETNMIYAASGDNVTNGKQGYFYRVDGETGELFPVGSTGFKEIEDLTFSPDGTLYAWAKGDGLITIDDFGTSGTSAALSSTLILPYKKPLIEGLTLKKNEGNVFFGAVGTDLWQYDRDTDTLDVLCPNKLLGETEALEITPNGLLLIGTHQVPFGLHAFDVQSCQVIEADETLSNKFDDVEGIALPVKDCPSSIFSSCDCDDDTFIPDCKDCGGGTCGSLAQEDLQVFETIFMEPFVLYMAIRSMVVVDYDIMGEWPIPLSSSITPPTGNYTAGFVTGEPPLYIEATMRSEAELEAALAAFNLDKANKACLAEVAGKVIRFIFNPDTRIWSCSVNIPNGVPPQHLDLFPMKCD